MSKGFIYYAVLREAPRAKVSTCIAELLRPDEGSIHKTTAAIVSRTCPEQLLDYAERRSRLDESWYQSLWLIALDNPGLRSRVEQLIPAAPRSALEARVRDFGKDAALAESAITLTPWEHPR